jgi:hypothetical protein
MRQAAAGIIAGNAQIASAALLGRHVGLDEVIDAPHFRYDFECVGPVERYRALNIRLRDELASLRLRNPDDIIVARSLERAIAEIPVEKKWADGYRNLVVTVGRNHLLDTYFSGSAYTASWFLGLVNGASAPTYNAADTMASNAGWDEIAPYSNANRPTLAFAAASAGSKATSAAAVFNINATATIAGGFTVTNNTVLGTTGILYSAGNFTGGNRAVQSGDTLNVSLTLSV